MFTLIKNNFLDCLYDSTENIHLELCAVSHFNDIIKNGIHFPIVYGIAIDLRDAKIVPASFIRKEPDIDIRSAQRHKKPDPIVIKLEFVYFA